jgi:hypothetical protein
MVQALMGHELNDDLHEIAPLAGKIQISASLPNTQPVVMTSRHWRAGFKNSPTLLNPALMVTSTRLRRCYDVHIMLIRTACSYVADVIPTCVGPAEVSPPGPSNE